MESYEQPRASSTAAAARLSRRNTLSSEELLSPRHTRPPGSRMSRSGSILSRVHRLPQRSGRVCGEACGDTGSSVPCWHVLLRVCSVRRWAGGGGRVYKHGARLLALL
eukprot:scaffold68216_cov66-Phaeocystis_antarctica.AAC.2